LGRKKGGVIGNRGGAVEKGEKKRTGLVINKGERGVVGAGGREM